MWVGVVRGFASAKFSGSEALNGTCVHSRIITAISGISGVRSFVEKNGWNVILSILVFVPIGLEDPVWCRASRCSITMAAMAMGRKKWRAKNRVKVGCDTENPPHIHSTSVFPRYGMAEKMFVITVAPQKDICPHGSTYPRKAVAISRNRIVIPVAQVCGFVAGEENRSPRLMCIYASRKNSEAPFMCRNREFHPLLTSREMCMTE